MSGNSSRRRALRREWRRKGYTTDESSGHGRVFDREGRLVATYALTPSTQESVRADWRKLDAPVQPFGIDRAGREQRTPADLADLGGGVVQRQPRDRSRELPIDPPRPPLAHGFDFPDIMTVPTPRTTDPAKAAAAREAARVQRWEHTAAEAICDLCTARSGPDTRLTILEGPREYRIGWFMRLDPTIDRYIASRLADRADGLVQLCESCWERKLGLPPAGHILTYEKLIDTAQAEDTYPMCVIVAEKPPPAEVPPAFRRQ